MTKEEISKLYREDYRGFCRYILTKAGDYATREEAQAEADKLRLQQTRELFDYIVHTNPPRGFDIGAVSCDG